MATVDVKGFTYGVALLERFSLFRIILGDFDVALLNDSNPVLCPLFFFLFAFFVFFVLLSMFLAIITQSYMTIRELTSRFGPDLTLARYLRTVRHVVARDLSKV